MPDTDLAYCQLCGFPFERPQRTGRGRQRLYCYDPCTAIQKARMNRREMFTKFYIEHGYSYTTYYRARRMLLDGIQRES